MKTAFTEKRISGVIALALLLALTLTSLVGCRGRVDEVGCATLVVAVGDDVREYEVKLDEVDAKGGAIALLDYLKAEGRLEYTSTNGGYGEYLTAVGHLKEDAANGVYVGIWTSVRADQDLESEYSTTVTYNGISLVSSGVGLRQLSVPDGAIIYFGELRY